MNVTRKQSTRPFLNPDINTAPVLDKVTAAFELKNTDKLKSIKVKSDGSKHYRHNKNFG